MGIWGRELNIFSLGSKCPPSDILKEGRVYPIKPRSSKGNFGEAGFCPRFPVRSHPPLLPPPTQVHEVAGGTWVTDSSGQRQPLSQPALGAELSCRPALP